MSGEGLNKLINKIVCGECSKVMEVLIPDGSVDLVVTSPPYDNLRDYKGYELDFGAIAKQLFRVMKEGGVVVWVVGDATIKGSETGTSFRQALGFMDVGFKLHDTMIYEKSGSPYPSANRYHQTFEYMFVLVKGNLRVFNPIEDRKNRWPGPWGIDTIRQKDGTLKTKKARAKAEEYGVRFNIWRYNSGGGFGTKSKLTYEHPATFPEALAEDHILSWSNKGGVVLDPFFGSGTTGVAALRHNRKFIGIDVSKEYCQLAQRRIEEEVKRIQHENDVSKDS